MFRSRIAQVLCLGGLCLVGAAVLGLMVSFVLAFSVPGNPVHLNAMTATDRYLVNEIMPLLFKISPIVGVAGVVMFAAGVMRGTARPNTRA